MGCLKRSFFTNRWRPKWSLPIPKPPFLPESFVFAKNSQKMSSRRCASIWAASKGRFRPKRRPDGFPNGRLKFQKRSFSLKNFVSTKTSQKLSLNDPNFDRCRHDDGATRSVFVDGIDGSTLGYIYTYTHAGHKDRPKPTAGRPTGRDFLCFFLRV